MALKTLQALIFLSLMATSCFAQAPAPSPITLLPPVESPTPVITPTAEPPSQAASPPVPVTEPTPAPATPPTVSPPTMSPKTSHVASPPKPESLAPGPSSLKPSPSPAPAPAPETPDADSALTNKAFLVSTVIAGALYAVVLA